MQPTHPIVDLTVQAQHEAGKRVHCGIASPPPRQQIVQHKPHCIDVLSRAALAHRQPCQHGRWLISGCFRSGDDSTFISSDDA